MNQGSANQGHNIPGNERDRSQSLLRSLNLRPHALRGQNFLVDEGIIRRILALDSFGPGDRVLEVGPGLGALTRPLARTVGSLTALEVEPALAALLAKEFNGQPHIQIVNIDALAFDYAAFGREEYCVCANLPYSITTPLLKKLLLNGGSWRSLTLMLQWEAARRICQGQGRANGPLPLLAEYCAERELCFPVERECFSPAPAVRSAVIRLRRRQSPPVAGDIHAILALAEAGFAGRRKTLVNSLSSARPQLSREFWQQGLTELGLPLNVRAEELGLPDFAALAAWQQANSAE